MKLAAPSKCNYDVYYRYLDQAVAVGVPTIKRHLKLNSLWPEAQREFKGARVKTESDYQMQAHLPKWKLGFSSPLRSLNNYFLMDTINHLGQHNTLFQFSYQMKGRVRADRKLSGLGAFSSSQVKLRRELLQV